MQSELDGVLDSVPSTAPCVDCFTLDTVEDSGPPAVDLTYSSVRGRLRKFAYFWRTLEVSQFILNVIMQGYKIPFFQLPTPFVKRNNSSARENSDFVSQAVSDLLRLDLIEEIACKPNIINPLPVSTRSSGKQRNDSFWIFKSISLFTSRSLNTRALALPHSYLAAIITCLNLILSPVTTMLKFSRTIENFSPLLGILARVFQIFSIFCASFRALFRSVYFQ